ncbi:MAG: hypothetical protein SFV54_01075 [Bryobacteraceae bacterium]|nr:hypothetical protein [Bryobacteraceae bacterium]
MKSNTSRAAVRPAGACIVFAIAALLLAIPPAASAGTFGKVVSIGGQGADLALDESRGVLYVANFTANRIEVVSVADGSVQTSFNVASQPSSLALSPDNRYLVIGHYGNFASPNAPRNAITLIDLTTSGRQTFAIALPPLGVAFGVDGLALIVTSGEFLLFDPVLGTIQALDTVANVSAKTLPQPANNYPPQIVAASVVASADGRRVFGVTDTILFTYEVEGRRLWGTGYTSSPPLGPRTISAPADGSYFLAGWAVFDNKGLLAQFPDPSGTLNIGSHAVDAARGLIYAQVTQSTPGSATQSGSGSGGSTPAPSPAAAVPVLQVVDADNLAVRERLLLPENLAGKSVLSSDGGTMYAISDSGVMILPVGSLSQEHRVEASVEDLVFRGSFCDRRVTTQELVIGNPGGGSTDFVVTSLLPGVSVTPNTGRTPALVRVSIDPNVFQNQRGTTIGALRISSQQAVNLVKDVRLLINMQEPDQRGTLMNVPGKLVDVLADPTRDRFFVLRQDTNEVLVYDARNYNLITRLRTGNTPTQMTATFDRRYLLVGNDNSQIANVFDLETLEAQQPIRFPGGHYPRSIAASANAILAAVRSAAGVHKIDRVDLASRTATELPTLGVFENNVNINTMLVGSPNGSSIIAAQADGTLLLYNANVDTFTVARKDSAAASGAVAASNSDFYVVGNNLLNSSLVRVRDFGVASGTSSGFAFIDQGGLRTTAATASSPGVIQRVDLANTSTRATRLVEAPVLGTAGAVFTRSLAPLYSRTAIVNLTTSGFTVLPWSYDASVAVPRIESVVNAADGARPVAPGGLIRVAGRELSVVNLASRERPLPTALGESCLTVNGQPIPMVLVSPNQINAQLPFTAEGNVTMVLRTPGGVSDNFNFTVLPSAPAVFRSGTAGPLTDIPTVVRVKNNALVTLSNPIHRGEDSLSIYLTGLGRTAPAVEAGNAAPQNPLSTAVIEPTVELGGVEIPVLFAGLTPGEVGVYQINVSIPPTVPLGMQVPLVIRQGGSTTTLTVRVID